MTHQSPQPTVLWFVKRGLYLVVFWIVAIGLLLYLSGVNINWRSRRLVPSASIALSTYQQKKLDLRYTLNGASAEVTLPTVIDDLTPGDYTIELTAPGKQSWRQSVRLDGYQAATFDSILFVPITLTPRAATSQENQALNRVKLYVSKGLLIRDTDLLDVRENGVETFITRLSIPIEQAVWLPDKEHIVIRADKNFFMMDANGTNSTPLFSVTEDRLLHLLVWDHGRVLVVERDNGAQSYELY